MQNGTLGSHYDRCVKWTLRTARILYYQIVGVTTARGTLMCESTIIINIMSTRQPVHPSGLPAVIFLTAGVGQIGLAGYFAFMAETTRLFAALLIGGLGVAFTLVGMKGLLSTDFSGIRERGFTAAIRELSFGFAVLFTIVGVSAIGWSGFLAFWLAPTEPTMWIGILLPAAIGSIFAIHGIGALLF